jgi:hypothetical protein
VLVELIEDDVRNRVALEFDHDPHAVPIALVPKVGDPFDLLVPHQLGDLLDQTRLVDHERNLGHDDPLRFPPLALLDVRARAHEDPPPTRRIRFVDPVAAIDEAARREVRPTHELAQIVDLTLRVVDQMHTRVDHFPQVVRRDVRRHAHRDPATPVDQKIGHLRREHHRLHEPVVEIGREVDRLLVDVGQQFRRQRRQLRLRIAIGGRGIPVDGPEVPLPRDQRITKREVLDHADQRVVDGGVAMRVVLTEDVSDHGRALLERAVRGETRLVHREEDAAMDGLEAVAYIR